MKMKMGTLYRTIWKDFGGQYRELVFQIVDADYEHHKGYTEYLIRAINPSTFAGIRGEYGSTMWIRGSHLTSCEELPKNHPAYLLYGKE